MRGAIPSLPQYDFMSWCLVKHRDNFTFYQPCLAGLPVGSNRIFLFFFIENYRQEGGGDLCCMFIKVTETGIYNVGVHPASYPMGTEGAFPGGTVAES
jgi:hypothetical protein